MRHVGAIVVSYRQPIQERWCTHGFDILRPHGGIPARRLLRASAGRRDRTRQRLGKRALRRPYARAHPLRRPPRTRRRHRGGPHGRVLALRARRTARGGLLRPPPLVRGRGLGVRRVPRRAVAAHGRHQASSHQRRRWHQPRAQARRLRDPQGPHQHRGHQPAHRTRSTCAMSSTALRTGAVCA